MVYGALGVGDQTGPSGSGVLATITGKALEEGSSALRLEDVQVFSTAPEAVAVAVEDGEIIVSEAGAPPSEPPDTSARPTPWGWIVAVALLVVVAAAAVALIARRRQRGRGSAIDSV
jgi:hypothetical protein